MAGSSTDRKAGAPAASACTAEAQVVDVENRAALTDAFAALAAELEAGLFGLGDDGQAKEAAEARAPWPQAASVAGRGSAQKAPAEPRRRGARLGLVERAPEASGRYCRGFNGEVCAFGPNGSRARVHGPARCTFCDQEKLNQSFLDAAASLALVRRFGRLAPFAREQALRRVQDPGFRAWLQGRAKFCQGLSGEPCIFGLGGAPAQPHGPLRCLFCDADRLNADVAEPAKRPHVAQRFALLTPGAQAEALARVADAAAREDLRASGRPAALEAPRRRRRQAADRADWAARGQAAQAAWSPVLTQRPGFN